MGLVVFSPFATFSLTPQDYGNPTCQLRVTKSVKIIQIEVDTPYIDRLNHSIPILHVKRLLYTQEELSLVIIPFSVKLTSNSTNYLNKYSSTFFALFCAIKQSSAAFKACSCVIAISVRSRQSRISSP